MSIKPRRKSRTNSSYKKNKKSTPSKRRTTSRYRVKGGDDINVTPEEIQAALIEAFRKTSNTINPTSVDGEVIILDDVSYRQIKILGEGGYGTVSLIVPIKPSEEASPSTTESPAKKRTRTEPLPKKALKMINLTNQINKSINKIAGTRSITTTIKNNITNVVINTIVNEIYVLNAIKRYCSEYFLCYDSIYYGMVTGDFVVFIVTEYLEGEDLFDFVGNKHEAGTYKDVTDDVKYQIIDNMCKGILRLHSISIAHRDIKPENIYVIKDPVTGKYKSKILDFGLSEILIAEKTYRFRGTPIYTMPEVLFSPCTNYLDVQYSDLWAAGMVVLFLFDPSLHERFQQVITNTFNTTLPSTPEQKAGFIYKNLLHILMHEGRIKAIDKAQPFKAEDFLSSSAAPRFQEFIFRGYFTNTLIMDIRRFLDSNKRQTYKKLFRLPEDIEEFTPLSESAFARSSTRSASSPATAATATTATATEGTATTAASTATVPMGETLGGFTIIEPKPLKMRDLPPKIRSVMEVNEKCMTSKTAYIMDDSGKIVKIEPNTKGALPSGLTLEDLKKSWMTLV